MLAIIPEIILKQRYTKSIKARTVNLLAFKERSIFRNWSVFVFVLLQLLNLLSSHLNLVKPVILILFKPILLYLGIKNNYYVI
jgi:hypothetical protein